MKTKIVFGIFFVSILLLIVPSISAIQLISADNSNETISPINTDVSKDLNELPTDTPPQWFTLFYNLIILSLNARIVIVTPFAITPTGEYWGQYDVNSYFFFLILLTLVYRFAFWYNFFDKISEKYNWDFP